MKDLALLMTYKTSLIPVTTFYVTASGYEYDQIGSHNRQEPSSVKSNTSHKNYFPLVHKGFRNRFALSSYGSPLLLISVVRDRTFMVSTSDLCWIRTALKERWTQYICQTYQRNSFQYSCTWIKKLAKTFCKFSSNF